MQYAGTFKNLAARLLSNSRTTTTTYRFRKNGANGTLNVAFGSTASGTVQDTTNSDAVVAGDFVNYAIVNGTGTLGVFPVFISVEYQTTSDPGTGLIVLANAVIGNTARNLTLYQPLGGSLNPDSTKAETLMQIKTAEAWTFKGLGINVITNTITPGATTATLRKNTTDTSLVASATAATTGCFQDTTHTETVAIGDLVNYKIVTGTGSGTQLISFTGLEIHTEMSSTPASITMTPNLVTVQNKIITKI
jgi:hypothetical protein